MRRKYFYEKIKYDRIVLFAIEAVKALETNAGPAENKIAAFIETINKTEILQKNLFKINLLTCQAEMLAPRTKKPTECGWLLFFLW